MSVGKQSAHKSCGRQPTLGNITFATLRTALWKGERSGKRPALRQKVVWYLSRHVVCLGKNLFELTDLQAG